VTSSPAATTSPTASVATFAVDPSAPWPVVLYEGGGNVVSQRTESASKELARPCRDIARLELRPVGLLAWCRGATQDSGQELHLISIPDGRVTALVPTTAASWAGSLWPSDVSPDGRSVAAARGGDCVSPEPVCQTSAILIDVATKSERALFPSGQRLGATLEWTALGLTFFQPECAEAGCSGTGDKGGTFVWDGSAWRRWSDLRFVARSGDWTLLERLRSFGEEPRTAVVRGPQGDTMFAGHALAIATNGDALVWRPGSPLEQRGMLLRLAPDGRVLLQAELVGSVMKMLGPDAFLATSPTNRIELYDLRRMLRFTPAPALSYIVAGVPR
jgi:hypothetical protein